MTHYILITDHTGDTVARYDADEMSDLYTYDEAKALIAGRVISKGTSLHADMLAICTQRNA